MDDFVLRTPRLQTRSDDLEREMAVGVIGIDISGVCPTVGQGGDDQLVGRRGAFQLEADVGIDLAVDTGDIDVADTDQANHQVHISAILVGRHAIFTDRICCVEPVAARAGEVLVPTPDAGVGHRGYVIPHEIQGLLRYEPAHHCHVGAGPLNVLFVCDQALVRNGGQATRGGARIEVGRRRRRFADLLCSRSVGCAVCVKERLL